MRNIIGDVLSYLSPYQRKRGLLIVLLLVLTTLFDFFSLATFLPLILLLTNPESITSNWYIHYFYIRLNPNSPAEFIVLLCIGILIFTIVKIIFTLGVTKYKAAYVFNVGSNLSSRALAHYMDISYLNFTQVDITKEMNRITSQTIAFANNVIMPLGTLLSEGLIFLLLLASVTFYDLKIFVFLLIILTPISLLYWLTRKQLNNTSLDLKYKYPQTLKYALQAIEGLFEIRSFNKESFFKERFATLSKSLAKTFARDHVTLTVTTRLTEIVTAFIICSIIIYSVLTEYNYQRTIFLLGIYAGVSFRLIPSLNRILNSLLQIKTHNHLFEELKHLKGYTDKEDYVIHNHPTFNSKIELKNISFQYANGAKVLDDISLSVGKGEKVAILGRSGSGKTTLLLILLGFLKRNKGEMLIDGNPCNDTVVWRGLFGYVPQSPYILDATVIENIAFGVPRTQFKIDKVQKLIRELDLEEMIKNMPDGLETQIGEKGIRISGGQRQRIAIARALYADSDILLLDEITNQLDRKTEDEIIKLIEKLILQKKTIVMITHNENLIRNFNHVYHLKDGKISIVSTEKHRIN